MTGVQTCALPICRGQGCSGRTVLVHPPRLPGGAPRAFTAEGPTGCGCDDTPVSRHCPAIKLKVFQAGLWELAASQSGRAQRQPRGRQSQGGIWSPRQGREGHFWLRRAQAHTSPQCPSLGRLAAPGGPSLHGRGSGRPGSPKPRLAHCSPRQPRAPGSPPTGLDLKGQAGPPREPLRQV